MIWCRLLLLSCIGALASLPVVAMEQSSDALLAKYPTLAEFTGKPAAVNLASHKDARRFRTVLRQTAPAGPNFAGHMTVATWGCGTSCQMVALIDARDGTVHFGPVSTVGIKHRISSRLLIIDSPEDIKEVWGDYDPPFKLVTTYYLWENNKLLEIKP